MRCLVLFVVLAALVAFGAAPVAAVHDWQTPKPLGLDVVTIDSGAAPAVCRTGSTVQKFRTEVSIFGVTPDEVESIANACGLRTIILHGGVTAYDPAAFSDLWHSAGWGDLVNRRPDIRWWVEIGNEPEFAGMESGAVAREVTLRTYKTLALGIGSGEPAWREAYPALLWLAALPLTLERLDAFLEYVPDNSRGWINQGAIVDWYDGIAPHVYGHYDVTDEHQWLVYNKAIRWPGMKSCVVTEAGINGLPPDEAMRVLAGFARWTPCEAVLAFAWFAEPCDWGGDAADSYHLCDNRTLDAIRAYNVGG